LRGFLPFAGRKALGICLALLSLLSVSTAFPAQPRKPSASRPIVKKPAPPKLSPIQLLARQLTANSVLEGETLLQACGHSNFKGLLWAFESAIDEIDQEKGEFESTAEFEARRERLTKAIDMPGGFVACSSPSDEVRLSYDADRQNFELSFDSDLVLAEDFKKTGTYVSRTAMGARANVTSYLSIKYHLNTKKSLARRVTECLAQSSYGPNRMYFYVPISDAARIKEDSIVIFSGKIVPPIFSKDRTPGNPTLDNPSDVYTVNLNLGFQIDSITVYDLGEAKELTRCSF
jgi:hypothetical protein